MTSPDIARGPQYVDPEMSQNGTIPPVRLLPVDDEKERTFREDVLGELDVIGLNTDAISDIESVDYNGVLIPNRIDYQVSVGSVQVQGEVRYELEYGEGDENENRVWDARVWVFPKNARDVATGKDIEVPGFVQHHGYVVFVRTPTGNGDPKMRVDSECRTSMIDNGHHSTAGHVGYGCDCHPQREEAKTAIHESGGLSILTPFEGRGNGDRIHAAQIQMQNWAIRKGQKPPGTYEAHRMAGAKGDSRRDNYWMDAAAFALVGERFDHLDLLTNNPDKIQAFQEAAGEIGVELRPTSLHAEGNAGYYDGPNFTEKTSEGGHGIK